MSHRGPATVAITLRLTLALVGGGGGSAASPPDGAVPDVNVNLDVGDDEGGSPVGDDAGGGVDAVPPDFVAAFPCQQPGDYVTTPLAIATVGVAYSPRCLKVPAGTVVSIESSGVHPLEPREVSAAPNPIPFQNTTSAVRFAAPGFYGFQCPEHSDQLMMGIVWVTP